jgi:hypothetical protein
MTRTWRKCRAAFAISLVVLLNACGGGSGGAGPAPLTGFTDPAQPSVATLNYLYSGYAGASPTAGDSFTPQLFLLIDASGRFYGSITSARGDSTPYSEDVVMGTLTVAGDQWTAAGATMLYRDAASSSFSAGTVSLSGTLGPERDVSGKLMAHVTFSGATVPLVANGFDLEAIHIGYAPLPVSLPNGTFFNSGTLSIDGASGRVQGLVASNCNIEGVMTLTTPNRNVLRLRAAFSGSGCAAVGFPEATGEFLGYVFVGANHAEGTGLDFYGIVNARRVQFSINSQTF